MGMEIEHEDEKDRRRALRKLKNETHTSHRKDPNGLRQPRMEPCHRFHHLPPRMMLNEEDMIDDEEEF